MKNLIKNVILCVCLACSASSAAQVVEHYPMAVAGSASDTFNVNILFGFHGFGVLAFDDVTLDGNALDVRAQGSIDGSIWYPLYLVPGSTGTPTLSAITIDTEAALFMPQSGFTSVSLERAFRYLRFITDATGAGSSTVTYKLMYKDQD